MIEGREGRRPLRIGLYYEDLDGPGGYPGDFRLVAEHLEKLGNEVVGYAGAPGPAYRRMAVRHAAGLHYFSTFEADLEPALHPVSFRAALGIPPPGDSDAELRVGGAPRPGFVFFGRNDVYQKGLDLLVEAFARARPDLSTHRTLRIVGRPWRGSKGRLRRMAKRLGVDDEVELVGPSPDLRPIAEASWFVYPSRYDGPPRPPRAALMLGVPLVVTDATNLGDGVRSHNAGFVAEASVESLAEQFRNADRVSEDERRAMARAALELTERWSWPRVAEDFERGYGEVLAGARGSS